MITRLGFPSPAHSTASSPKRSVTVTPSISIFSNPGFASNNRRTCPAVRECQRFPIFNDLNPTRAPESHGTDMFSSATSFSRPACPQNRSSGCPKPQRMK
ncbi:hypothetical protein M407DRAFT_246536 [Tulasnella calospora MUT 4182]|uniref:Uncharacterized protein n=1 Tax=Tulasnella calospora MUT 4182 TaxID=1051891 RepID=A0A0C3K9W7_9AGAM|nr:hypothetical protein M407DRAFT_246536 [Tulasnella calospora MUT 4182]